MKPAMLKQRQYHQEFEKLIRNLCHRYQIWQVFSDFCEMAALSMANAINVGTTQNQEREARYLKLINGYERLEDRQVFPRLLALTVEALEDERGDFLGEMFMHLELGNHWHGQFFTPVALCNLMAAITLTGLEQTIRDQGFAMVQEPACGAGATIIGLVNACLERDLNPQECLHVTAIDVDATAAHMCFIQLSLLGIPATVCIGNTLSMQIREWFHTPAHHLGFWDSKLRRRREEQAGEGAIELSPLVIAPAPAPQEQPEMEPAPVLVHDALPDGQMDLFELLAQQGAA